MGNFLDTPITEKETSVDESSTLGLSYGLSAMQGWRASMEDDHVQLLGLPDVRADRPFFFACSRTTTLRNHQHRTQPAHEPAMRCDAPPPLTTSACIGSYRK